MDFQKVLRLIKIKYNWFYLENLRDYKKIESWQRKLIQVTDRLKPLAMQFSIVKRHDVITLKAT